MHEVHIGRRKESGRSTAWSTDMHNSEDKRSRSIDRPIDRLEETQHSIVKPGRPPGDHQECTIGACTTSGWPPGRPLIDSASFLFEFWLHVWSDFRVFYSFSSWILCIYIEGVLSLFFYSRVSDWSRQPLWISRGRNKWYQSFWVHWNRWSRSFFENPI